MTYCGEHLARDGDAFLARLRARACLTHTLPDGVGDLHAWHLVVQELCVAIASERQEADEHGQIEGRDIVEEALKHARIIDGLGHHQLGASVLLQAQPS